jgi:hypothetical protein
LSVLAAIFGAGLAVAAAFGLGRRLLPASPGVVQLAAGVPLLSLSVFALLAAQAANRGALMLLCAAAMAAGAVRKQARSLPAVAPPSFLWVALAPYAALYTIHALAPEIQPDAINYHLGLLREFLHVKGFPARVAFYEMLPHGAETIFLPAYAVGGAVGAKLVHFSFLAATVPMILDIGLRLGLSAATSAAAAAFYVISPVTGVTGTSAYTDVLLTFAALAALRLLLEWEQHGGWVILAAAGLLAGFCYSVKMTGAVAAAGVLLYLAGRRLWKAALVFGAAAALVAAPWLVRNALRCGNPLAPFFNAWFPNHYFHTASERVLLESLGARSVPAATLPLELTIRGRRLQGLLGPVFLLTPVGLLALRRREGRRVAGAALMFAIPWLLNSGTRFLLPALPWVSLLLAMALPGKLRLLALAFHAFSSWPAIAGWYADAGAWRLQGFPWRAALGIESERDYLQRVLPAYRVAKMIERHTPAGVRILDLVGAPKGYVNRDLVVFWESALGQRLVAALALATRQEPGLLRRIEAAWPELELEAVRLGWAGPRAPSWNLHEIRFFSRMGPIPTDRTWLLSARPNVWEAPYALDGNLVSRWSTWEPARPDMFFEVSFRRPLALVALTAVSTEAGDVVIQGRLSTGGWRLLAEKPPDRPYPPVDLKASAIRVLKRSGVGFILTPVAGEGTGRIGLLLADRASDWGVAREASADGAMLFRIL